LNAMSSRTLSRSAFSKRALVWGLFAWMGIAQAGLFEDDEARKAILDLRQRVEQSNAVIKGLSGENAQLRRSLLDLSGQIENLKTEISQGRGAHERLAKDLSEVQIQNKDVNRNLDDRFRPLELRLGGFESRLSSFEPQKVSLDGLDFVAESAEKRDYEAAMETFRKGDFVAAQLSLTQFVQRYRASGYGPTAQFWLGNAQYANKDYKESMANFQQMLKSSPAHPRAPEAMLAVSNVQIELKDLKAARKTLEELVKTYPASETAATARDRLARLR
jgi:tol-pal system protein YbgF